MKKPDRLPPEPTEEEIQHAAYFLWEQEGRPAGRDREIWLAARARLVHSAHMRDRAPPRPSAAATLARNAEPPGRKSR